MEKISSNCVDLGFDETSGIERLKSGAFRYLRPDDDEREDAESSSGSSFSVEENSSKRTGDHIISVESGDGISSQKLKKKRTGDHISVESDDDDVIYSQKLKKNRTEEKSGGMGNNSFLYSCADKECDGYAQPLIRCAWTGCFDIWYDELEFHRIIHNFNAYLSSKACQKVCDVAAELEPELHFVMLPKSCLWPKRFRESGPRADDIALYFFPSSTKHETLYDSFVSEMIRYDWCLSAFVKNSNLLIFTSDELPLRFRRFQGNFYLWGVFAGKQFPL